MGRRIFTAIVVGLFLYVISPMLFPVIMGAVLAALFFPLQERLERRGWSVPATAGLLTFAITLLVLIPTTTLTFLGARAGIQQIQAYREAPKIEGGSWLENVMAMPQLRNVTAWLAKWFPNGIEELKSTAQEVSRSVILKLGELLGNLVGYIPGMVMATAVIMVSVYFFLVDGRRLVAFFRRHSFFTSSQTDRLIKAAGVMCRSVILASVVSGAIQSAVEMFALLVTGTENVLFVGLLVFLASFVPVIGSAPLTFGVAIQQLLLGRTVAGIFLGAFAILIGLIDNVVRPVFLRGAANLHPLLAFVAAFGGLQTLGFFGVFLGPIAAAIFVLTIEIVTSEQQTPLTRA